MDKEKINMDKERIEKAFKGKRKNENLLVLIILMIVVVVAINYIWNGKPSEKSQNYMGQNLIENYVTKVSDESKNDELEKKLEAILSNMVGVGKVKVMITYSNSSTIEPMYDETYKESNTVENDDSGGTRSISETDNQKQVIYKQNSDGSKEPVTKNTISPTIEGAIITAEGAGSATVKSNIVQAVEAGTGLPTHKIQVFEMEVD